MMNITNLILLSLTIALSAGRNMLSKNVSRTAFGNKSFYRLQGCIFIAGAIALLFFTNKHIPSTTTIYLALVYALFLILAQWCYTIALSNIDVSICSTIYSLGFIIPTLSGSMFWNEKFTIFDFCGLCCVIVAIVISGNNKKKDNSSPSDKRYFIALVVAMLASGGLGLVQKIQQSSSYSNEKDLFVTIAFLTAAFVSIIFSMFAKKDRNTVDKRQFVFAFLTGICFGSCNLLNTTLAGKLDSALFFPLQNISVILLSIALSCIITKEKLSKQSAIIFALGSLAIIFLNI